MPRNCRPRCLSTAEGVVGRGGFSRKAAEEIVPCDEGLFETLVRRGFSERRKQLRNMLPEYKGCGGPKSLQPSRRARDGAGGGTGVGAMGEADAFRAAKRGAERGGDFLPWWMNTMR